MYPDIRFVCISAHDCSLANLALSCQIVSTAVRKYNDVSMHPFVRYCIVCDDAQQVIF
jgi:hypothetical protein